MQIDMVPGTMGDNVKLVKLFRCKACGVRMFERDTLGHAKRHGIESTEDHLKQFIEGDRGIPDRPGISNAYSRPKKKKKQSPKHKQA